MVCSSLSDDNSDDNTPTKQASARERGRKRSATARKTKPLIKKMKFTPVNKRNAAHESEIIELPTSPFALPPLHRTKLLPPPPPKNASAHDATKGGANSSPHVPVNADPCALMQRGAELALTAQAAPNRLLSDAIRLFSAAGAAAATQRSAAATAEAEFIDVMEQLPLTSTKLHWKDFVSLDADDYALFLASVPDFGMRVTLKRLFRNARGQII
jgi:hypothetical protein